jgi:hypothetical protein
VGGAGAQALQAGARLAQPLQLLQEAAGCEEVCVKGGGHARREDAGQLLGQRLRHLGQDGAAQEVEDVQARLRGQRGVQQLPALLLQPGQQLLQQRRQRAVLAGCVGRGSGHLSTPIHSMAQRLPAG